MPIRIRPVSLRDGFDLFLRAGHVAAGRAVHPLVLPDLELRLQFDPRWNPYSARERDPGLRRAQRGRSGRADRRNRGPRASGQA
ncbi:MAG: hypothetical protein RML45_01190 [Acetobacteraceae bacterium]|nr:hypothetical protein [Acetobacteraceae bacterium]